MTGNELIEFIRKNHYENIEIMIPDKWNYHCRIKLVYCKNNNSELKIASIFDKNELPKEVLIVKSEYDK